MRIDRALMMSWEIQLNGSIYLATSIVWLD